MLSLFERYQREGTEAFYRMQKFPRLQKLLHFEVRDFGRISFKKIRNKTKYTMDPGIYFLMKTNKKEIIIKELKTA